MDRQRYQHRVYQHQNRRSTGTGPNTDFRNVIAILRTVVSTVKCI